jgi:hypothetical protein
MRLDEMVSKGSGALIGPRSSAPCRLQLAVSGSRGSFFRRLHIAGLIGLVAMLSATACSNQSRRNTNETESARMGDDEKPWWHDMMEKQKARSRERVAKLIENSKIYRRPPADPEIYASGKGNRIAIVDRTTGYYLLSTAGDENLMLVFNYMTNEDKLVCSFKTQWGGGYRMEWDAYPIRVYDVIHPGQALDGTRAARGCISIERFAQFMSAHPDLNNPEKDFVVIDAPATGERP